MGFPGGSIGKELETVDCRVQVETLVQSLGPEDLLEHEMATHSSILTRRIPWTVAHQAPLSMGSQRVRHD